MTQLEKNLTALGALVVVSGALGLYAYFGVLKTEEREAQRKETSEKLFAASSGEKLPDGGTPPAPVFTSIVVKAKGEVTTLEKKGEQWWITAPNNAKADKSAVDQLVSQLQTARVKATVEDNPTDADLAKYGLDHPRFTVTAYAYLPDAKGEGATEPSRRREVQLYGGIENTYDGSAYLRRGTEKAVYAIDGFAKQSLEKTTFDLRDKEVLAIDEAIQQIEFKSKANRYLLERADAKAWRLASPKLGTADSAVVGSMLSSFRNDRAVAFLTDSPEERKRSGVTSPASDVTFLQASGEKVRIRLSKVKVGSDEKAFALRESGGEPALAEVALAAVTALDKSPLELRDKSVLSFNREQVARITFAPGGGAPPIVVEKMSSDAGPNEDWRITVPSAAPAKKWKLSSVLWSLSSLKASSIGEDNPKDWGKYGIAASSRSVTLADNGGKALARLELGSEVKGKPGAVYAKGSRGALLEIDSSRLSEVPWKTADLIEQPAPAIDGGASGVSSN